MKVNMNIKPKIITGILGLIFLILGIEVFYLAVAYKKLENENRVLKFLLYMPTEVMKSSGQENTPLPNFNVMDIKTQNKTKILDREIKEKMLLFVFSTDCYTCNQASNIWNELYDRWGDVYTIIGISKDDNASIETYVLRNKIRFPVYRYEKFSDFDYFGTLPRSYSINKNGIILAALNGIPQDMEIALCK
jgi:hypothetical protein